jgi:NAD(P)H-hydrate repair Nnr-like enzyme with NAD(P)H-hydrate epimerase domain
VLCGVGNNAGDGYVIRAARAAREASPLSWRALGESRTTRGRRGSGLSRFVADGGAAGAFDASASRRLDLVVDACSGAA